ncbi:GntR family transcriptional regulator [Desulfitibacter alkalitolerans]|uniref:GntR family transcriptional regulator n=1 Tax=Desulfitibacter alkalitolerans TaxID=264641 RepID=UPI000484484E|nr:GntR family transcriptional regulator [Desulfitibacter alkalitolerans]
MERVINLERRQVHEQIYDYLKNAILNGELKPGEKLNQDELAKQFGTSRMPVRDALRLLQNDWLVENLPNKGFTVVEFSEEQLKDTLLFRSILEKEAVCLVKGRLTSEDIEKLETLAKEMEQCIERNNLSDMPKLNYEFHFTIYNLVPSKKMLETIKLLWDSFPRYAMLSTNEAALLSQNKHEMIINAIKNGDFEAAGELMRKHILRTNTSINKCE